MISLLTSPARHFCFSILYHLGRLWDMLGCIILPCADITLEIGTLTILLCGWYGFQGRGYCAFSLCRHPSVGQTFYTLSFSTLYEGGEGNWQHDIPHRSVIEQPVSLPKGVIPLFKRLGENRIQY